MIQGPPDSNKGTEKDTGLCIESFTH
jgi:hypothetical protein